MGFAARLVAGWVALIGFIAVVACSDGADVRPDRASSTAAPTTAREGGCAPSVSLELVYNEVATYEETGDLVGIDAEGNRSQLTEDGGSFDPDFSPDGQRLVFSGSGGVPVSDTVGPVVLSLYVMNADGSGRRRLTDGKADEDPEWSPDGRLIAFSHNPSGDRIGGDGIPRIYLVDADGSDPRPLRPEDDEASREFSPTWSPDGEQIAFLRGVGDESAAFASVWVTDVDGGIGRQVLGPIRNIRSLAWSPNGRSIAFDTYRSGFRIMQFDPAHPQPRVLVGSAVDPEWSGDGSSLYFSLTGPASSDVSRLDLQTDERRTLAMQGHAYDEFGIAASPCSDKQRSP